MVAPGQIRHNNKPGPALRYLQRVGGSPSRVVHFGQRSREAVERLARLAGGKGRPAREWIPAGHGCSGRRPSSLLAVSVWLAPKE